MHAYTAAPYGLRLENWPHNASTVIAVMAIFWEYNIFHRSHGMTRGAACNRSCQECRTLPYAARQRLSDVKHHTR